MTERSEAGRKLVALAGLGILLGCADEPTGVVGPPPGTGPIASNPILNAPGSLPLSVASLSYVSLPPGTLDGGQLAVLHVNGSGPVAMAGMSDGGLDPTPVAAAAGDSILVEVTVSGATAPSLLAFEVPPKTPPKVVRTRPARGKRDVPLNDVVVVVFSEPIAPRSVGPGSIRLERGGTSIPAAIRQTADGLELELRPEQNLAPRTDYTLRITTQIRDLEGDALEQEYTSTFSTGTSVAAASAEVIPAGLITTITGEIRTFEFEAVRDTMGVVTGWFRGYNPVSDIAWSGVITCFTITEGRIAWMAGTVEQNTSDWLEGEVAWKAVDSGPNGNAVPDLLSMNEPLTVNGLGTAAEFCATTPDLGVSLVPRDLVSGDVVVRPPLSGAAASLAFTAQPRNVPPGRPMEPIRVVAVDADGEVVTDFTGAITLELAAGAGSASLEGPATVQAAGGLAEFTGLAVIGASGVFSLTAASSGLLPVESAPFEVVPIAPGRIVFYRWFRDGTPEGLHVMASDGSGMTRLTADEDRWPTWSPDTARIAFERVQEPAVYVMNADGTDARRIHAGGAPAWSPDGTRIAFISDHATAGPWRLYTVNPDGSGLQEVVTNEAMGRPAWSPDGQRIAFVSQVHPDSGNDAVNLYTVRADGTELRKLTDVRPCLQVVEPAWSPDGTAIAFTVDHSWEDWEDCATELLGLHMIDPDGSNMRRVGTRWSLDRGVTWSPDGTQFAVTHRYDDLGGCGFTIAVQRPDGSGRVRLDREGCGFHPAWSP